MSKQIGKHCPRIEAAGAICICCNTHKNRVEFLTRSKKGQLPPVCTMCYLFGRKKECENLLTNLGYRRKAGQSKEKNPSGLATVPISLEAKMACAKKMRDTPTPAEAHLAKALLTAGILVETQPVLFGYISDFRVRGLRLIIEVDGLYHSTPEQIEKDKQRDAHFREKGYRTLRYTNEEVLCATSLCIAEIKEFMPIVNLQIIPKLKPKVAPINSRSILIAKGGEGLIRKPRSNQQANTLSKKQRAKRRKKELQRAEKEYLSGVSRLTHQCLSGDTRPYSGGVKRALGMPKQTTVIIPPHHLV